MLIARGLPLGRPPEEWNDTHPEIVRGVHASYIEAGAAVITANTFGGTPSRLSSYGLGGRTGELNRRGVELAAAAIAGFEGPSGAPDGSGAAPSSAAPSAPENARFVALSVGPTGKMFPPVGTADEGRLREEFDVQLDGAASGCDLVLVETMYDLREALIALSAAKRAFPAKPVAVTLTFNVNPRGYYTVMGNEAAASMRVLVDAGADAAGANCTLTSGEMIPLARVLRDSTDLPMLCQPNAGKPRIKDGIPVYEQRPEEFARDALELFEIGINAVGGCCGTTPAFIREISAGAHKR